MDVSGAITPNAFTGGDSERINQALRAAAGTGRPVVVPRWNESASGRRDLWRLDSAVLVPGDTTLILDHCHLKLSDRCRDNLIRSANCGPGGQGIETLRRICIQGIGRVILEGADRPRATGDGAKVLGERTYGTDAGVPGENPNGDWRNIGILMAFVEDFRIENLHLRDTHAWAISLERCGHGIVRDIDFESSGKKLIDGVEQTILNQDGLDLRQGCHDIMIEGITGETGDDLIALTGLWVGSPPPDNSRSTMVSAPMRLEGGADDIRHIMLRRIRGYCRGRHHVVRLLNGGGVRLHDVVIDGLIDTSPSDRPCKATIKIGDNNPRWGGVTPLGDTARVLISNVISTSLHTILIAGSLTDSCISNVIRATPGGAVITMESGPGNLCRVSTATLVHTGGSGGAAAV